MYFNVLLNTQRIAKDGKAQVVLYVTLHGRARYVFPFRVEPSRWDPAHKRVRPGGNAVEFNRVIASTIARAEVLALAEGMTAGTLVRALGGPDPTGKTFVDLARSWNEREAKRIAAHTIRVRGTVLRDFERACPGAVSITREVLRAFEDHLLSMDLVPNTRRARMKMLRTMYRGVCDMAGVVPSDVFKGMIRAEEETAARGLTAEEVAKLEAVKLSTYEQQVARDAFLFSMYTGGIRFGDVCRLRPSNVVDGALEYRANKSRKPLWIPLIPQALAIIEAYRGDPYLLPILNGRTESERGIDVANAATNQRLKKVAKYAGVNPGLSFHYARHSFGHWAAKNKVPVDMLRMIFGHSSLAITQRYMQRLDREGLREVFGKMHG